MEEVDPQAPDDPLAAVSGEIGWDELARHFARGTVIKVADGADLRDVAQLMIADDARAVEGLLGGGTVARASDDDAREWVARAPRFDCVVVAPWVLVQARPDRG